MHCLHFNAAGDAHYLFSVRAPRLTCVALLRASHLVRGRLSRLAHRCSTPRTDMLPAAQTPNMKSPPKAPPAPSPGRDAAVAGLVGLFGAAQEPATEATVEQPATTTGGEAGLAVAEAQIAAADAQVAQVQGGGGDEPLNAIANASRAISMAMAMGGHAGSAIAYEQPPVPPQAPIMLAQPVYETFQPPPQTSAAMVPLVQAQMVPAYPAQEQYMMPPPQDNGTFLTEAGGYKLFTSKASATGYTGVRATQNGRFRAERKVDGECIYLGYYDTALEAAIAVAKKAAEDGRTDQRQHVDRHSQWTDQEDNMILQGVATYGFKWGLIASTLSKAPSAQRTYTANAVRNRYLRTQGANKQASDAIAAQQASMQGSVAIQTPVGTAYANPAELAQAASVNQPAVNHAEMMQAMQPSGGMMQAEPKTNRPHWSGVGKGEAFYITLEYDPNTYAQPTVPVMMRRNPATGLTESADPRWRWAVQSPYGEGHQKAIAAARKSGLFTPPMSMPRPAAPLPVAPPGAFAGDWASWGGQPPPGAMEQGGAPVSAEAIAEVQAEATGLSAQAYAEAQTAMIQSTAPIATAVAVEAGQQPDVDADGAPASSMVNESVADQLWGGYGPSGDVVPEESSRKRAREE